MTPERYEKIRRVFIEASGLAVEQRAAFLSTACAGDEALLREVSGLLASESDAATFLEQPAIPVDLRQSMTDNKVPPSHPQRIGRFEIVGILGEGGMGIVYEARQERPERSVALKVIRPGLVTGPLLRRFELEAEVLGLLHHPGIAQIYDAGMAETGAGVQPYFAMELVRGRPIVDHAERHRLDARKRLQLVARVADAVEHAHQRGVIHRDLKPANILVDDSGQPKVLDFGVARAADSDLQVTTIQTEVGQLIGTLAYMSPEQVAGDRAEVDTRTDIYALGVISYELLGRRPPHRTDGRSIPEVVRMISEDPPDRLSSVDMDCRGDVETIVSTAMDKDKSRRYDSASAFADDIRRYLANEPIAARPPSTFYTLSKFARRNRGLVAGFAVAVIALLAGIIGMYQQAVIATDERDRARVEADKAQAALTFVEQMFSVDPDVDGREVTVYEMLGKAATRAADELADQPEVESTVTATIATSYQSLGRHADARRLHERTLDLERRLHDEDHPDVAMAKSRLAILLEKMSEVELAERLLREALPIIKAHYGPDHDEYRSVLMNLGLAIERQGRLDEAETFLREAVDSARRTHGAAHPQTLGALNNLATIAWGQSRLDETESILREIVSIEREAGDRSTAALIHLDNLGTVLAVQGKFSEAEQMHREALEGLRTVRGDAHPDTLVAGRNLADVLYRQRRVEEAVAIASEALEVERQKHGETQRLINALADLATYRNYLGQSAEAERLLNEAIELGQRLFGPDQIDTLNSMSKLAVMHFRNGNLEAAEAVMREALPRMRESLGNDHLMTLLTIDVLAQVRGRRGDLDEAEELILEAIATGRQALPPKQWRHAMFQLHYGTILTLKGKFDAAETELVAAYDGLNAAFGAQSGRTRTAADELRKLYEAWNKTKQAETWKAKSQPASQTPTEQDSGTG